ncbi:unnamed protein product [Orchesella dallaii]|uniref:Retrotransposon gag domain-containing protein n=1 Tax=Orchesella dallaii TaxID=48710 RepID=A0ABP1Q0B4_9HEXA
MSSKKDLSPRKTRTQGNATERDVNIVLQSNKQLNKLVNQTDKTKTPSGSVSDDPLHNQSHSTEQLLSQPSTSAVTCETTKDNEFSEQDVFGTPVISPLRRFSTLEDLQSNSEPIKFNVDYMEGASSEQLSDSDKTIFSDFDATNFDTNVKSDSEQETLVPPPKPLSPNTIARIRGLFNKKTTTVPAPPSATMATPPTLMYTPPGANQIFDGSSNTTEFFDRFDNYALVFGWTDAIKLSQLRFYLMSTPLQAYKLKLATGNAAGHTVTYAEMKKHLKDSFATSITSEEYRRRLQNRRKDPQESADTYYFDVVYLCSKVDKTMTDADIIRHLIKGLPHALGKEIFLKGKTKHSEVLKELIEHAKFESIVGTSTNTDEIHNIEIAVVQALKKLNLLPTESKPESEVNSHERPNHGQNQNSNRRGNGNRHNNRGRSTGNNYRGNRRGTRNAFRGNRGHNYNYNHNNRGYLHNNYNRGRGPYRGNYDRDYYGRSYYPEPSYYGPRTGYPPQPPPPPGRGAQAHHIDYHDAPPPPSHAYYTTYMPYQGN